MAERQPIVTAYGLCKSYGRTQVLHDLDLEIHQGQVLALLGPNGAGKTTTVRILATLLRPDRGEIRIWGFDPQREPRKVQALIGLSGQSASVDEQLSARDNLTMFGRLQRLSARVAARRAEELLEQFGLADVAGDAVKTYSGGMRRELDLACSLVVAPPLIFLDEPTAGLDPTSRHALWTTVEELVSRGSTILLTTHYLEEADRLADAICIIDKGRAIARGSAAELKATLGGSRFDITAATPGGYDQLRSLVGEAALIVDPRTRTLSVKAEGGLEGLRSLHAILDQVSRTGIPIESYGMHEPSLDEVFEQLTGQAGQRSAQLRSA